MKEDGVSNGGSVNDDIVYRIIEAIGLADSNMIFGCNLE